MKKSAYFLIIAFLSLVLPVFGQKPDNRGVINRPTTLSAGEKRLALVIGNAAYKNVDKLKNPVNDANDTATALRKLGFEVISGTDLNLLQMQNLVREFGIKLQRQKGVGLFYYAGHGIRVGGRNYLLPVEADIATETETSFYSLDSNLVLRYMSDAGNEFNMMILDACRNNPFARSWRQVNPDRALGEDSGLALMGPPRGTIIVYSTESGNVASDGPGRNGLFTEAFLAQIYKPVEFDDLIKLIAKDVRQKSNNRQMPWKEGFYEGRFFFLDASESAELKNLTPTPVPEKKINPPDNKISGGLVRVLTYGQKYMLRGTVISINANNFVIMDKLNFYTKVILPVPRGDRFDGLKVGVTVLVKGKGEITGSLAITDLEIVKPNV